MLFSTFLITIAEKDNSTAQKFNESIVFDSTGETNKYDEIINTFLEGKTY